MTHILSIESRPASSALRLRANALSVGRFVLHFGEMVLAMYVGMLMYMPLEGLVPVFLQGIGMALFMAWPMVVWMRIRGHGWRHGFEMALAMLVPWAAVVGLVGLGAANALPWLKQGSDPAMCLGMLGFMLVRRDHHAHGGAHEHVHASDVSKRTRRIPWRRLFLVTAYLSAILLVPAGAGTVNFWYKEIGGPVEPFQPPAYSGALPALPTPDPSKKIAVVLSGPAGSEIGDTMEAFEILARSGVYNVYSVAPERTVLPLNPGPSYGASSMDFVPHFSFAEYDTQIGRAPDLIAIPFFDPNYTPERDAGVLAWIRANFGPNTTLLGICSGNEILADTGLEAGRTATTNTGTFDYVQSHAPTTTWLHNVRYVDDGNIVTSSNLTSGIDATLHIVDRVAGRAIALDVARQIGFTHTSTLDDARFEPPTDNLVQIATNAALQFPPQKEQLGVLVYDGVTELGMSGLVDPIAGSLSARTFVMAPERRIVQSRDGFLFLPRYSFATAPGLDRVVVAAGENDAAKQQVVAAWSASHPRQLAEDLYRNLGSGQSAYDVSFADLAPTHNAFIARTMAHILFYTTDSSFPDAAWPIREVLAQLALMLFGAGLVYAATRLRLPRQRRLRPILQHA